MALDFSSPLVYVVFHLLCRVVAEVIVWVWRCYEMKPRDR